MEPNDILSLKIKVGVLNLLFLVAALVKELPDTGYRILSWFFSCFLQFTVKRFHIFKAMVIQKVVRITLY